MSFILDALKKSENERQRRSGPSLADVRTGAPERKRPPWLVPLIGLLAINIFAVAAVLLWPAKESPAPRQVAAERIPPPTPPSTARPAPPAPTPRIDPDPPPVKPTPAPRPAVRSLAAETGPAAAETAAAAQSAPAARVAPPPTPTRSSPGTVVDDEIPTFAELVVDGRLSLAHLHVDIHVYSAKPKGRFVFVNNKKYREGDFLNEGPRVEEISTTGVILSHQGERFLLPRD